MPLPEIWEYFITQYLLFWLFLSFYFKWALTNRDSALHILSVVISRSTESLFWLNSEVFLYHLGKKNKKKSF